MNKITHLCFDLDGTLINSFYNIYFATNETLKRLGIKALINEADFRLTIGLHFNEIFEKLNIPVNDFEEFISLYKKIYFDFIDSSKIYPAVIETLQLLYTKNIKISLLTTKAQDQTDKIIDHFELRKYFSLVMGRRDGIAHKPSAEPLQIICKELNVFPSATIMAGDTELDIRCGKAAGTQTCAVNYGYRTEELLLKEEPDFLINSIEEIILLVS
ncbi:MAG: HAD-IA family hydrolase [Ignavibacteriales bacterium]|nr:HAD-IA family hydrolase [Ignavibacteriales bacterium]